MFTVIMAEVTRKGYLERLMSGKDRTDTIKIITGMRRCGKTTLMNQYIRSLKDSGIDDKHIISFNFESKEAQSITDGKTLLQKIDERYAGKRIYVFLDEIQRVKEWENAVNSLQVDYDADIYITGSNGYLLSSELSTYLSGRYVEMQMLPLSFAEFLELHPGDKDERFMQYIRSGSLPVIDPDADETFERDHLIGIYNTVLVKDVLTHSGAADAAVLNDIVRFLYSNIGNITSCNKIADVLKEDNRKVRKYIDALQEAYLIYKAERYDVRGKKLLDTLEKYYVSDTGMRNAVLGMSSREDISRQIENIVYLELIRRGYEVAVGKYGDLEVDFTARKGNVIEYYQVTMSMLSEDVHERETRSLKLIKDNYVKTILSLDKFLIDLPDGIRHENAISWLLERS
jgi:Predicted ATPase (AAA+ superfamily)